MHDVSKPNNIANLTAEAQLPYASILVVIPDHHLCIATSKRQSVAMSRLELRSEQAKIGQRSCRNAPGSSNMPMEKIGRATRA